jgi:parvulin-like peptidyl-prolyl isomerase
MFSRGLLVGALMGACLFAGTARADQASADPPSPGAEAVAKVDGAAISRGEYEAALARTVRQKFYHGKVDETKMADVRKEVLDELVLERLLVREAERRHVEPDAADVDRKIAAYEERYRDSEMWKAQRERLLPDLRAKMLENSRKAVMERGVRAEVVKTPENVEKFYRENPALFTEPEQDHLATILLQVDPAATKETWAEAQAEAGRIRAKILAGAGFADLAKLHSADQSAANGGDMGYLHHGMLAQPAQEAIDPLKPGEITEAVELLQGYGLFKLIDRKPAKLRAFEDVRDRAADLYARHAGEKNWVAFCEELKRKAKIWISPTVTAAAASPR